MRLVPKEVDTLWTLFTAPVVWAGHFLFCYISAALICAKPDLFGVTFGALRVAIAAVTIAALSAILLSSFLAWRQWGFGTDDPPHDEPTRRDRVLFQGFATLLLSGLSFIAVVMTALPALFLTECLR
ncbi:hypothetical protein ACIQUG_21805 [Ensifer sp. NPDC090286]|uniref:hypothetical protein n=1 Tax=Ensifer sp. NPDC090286 TaxID=3363991 RepID=UPI00383BDDB3